MKKLMYFFLSVLFIGASFISKGQELDIYNDSADDWTVDYFGIVVNVAAGNDMLNIDISGADCNRAVEINITGTTLCEQTISLGGTDVNTCSSGGTDKCQWDVIGVGNDPCGTTIMDAEITFF